MNILYYPRKENVIVDALNHMSMGTLAYLRPHEMQIGKEIRRLSSLRVQLDEVANGKLTRIIQARSDVVE